MEPKPQYKDSENVFERAAFWLADYSWINSGGVIFEDLQKLSKDVIAESKALESNNERLKQRILDTIVALVGNIDGP